VPPIVQGYANDTYGAWGFVTRDQMAAFVSRALYLPLSPYRAVFDDVPETFWDAAEIEALVQAGVVEGTTPTTYSPYDSVTREQMAAFLARALCGGDANVPAGPAAATFADVPTTHWAYDYVEYLFARTVTLGTDSTHYDPTSFVGRDQMAVFLYRAFLAPAPSVVVLGGAAVTAQDPTTGGECGWATIEWSPTSAPGYAYVAFDAFRLDESLAASGAWPVHFELRSVNYPETPATGAYAYTRTFTAADIHAARQAALASGRPHWVVSWEIPAGLTPATYRVVISAQDPTGIMRRIPHWTYLTIRP
jgi:S-layer family protein